MKLQTTIDRDGQSYVDDPVYAFPKMPTPVESAVAAAFEREMPRPITVGHERVRLRWMKPDGHGGVIPR